MTLAVYEISKILYLISGIIPTKNISGIIKI